MSDIQASTEDQPRAYFHPAIRFAAHFFSFVFHPVFITSYLIAFLLFLHPFVFAGYDPRLKVLRFLTVFLSTTMLPVFAVFMLWRLDLFVKSYQLLTARERIVPYAIALIFYWWPYHVYQNLPDTPPEAIKLLLGSFLAVCGGWMCNIFYKVSMHGIAVGGMLMYMLLFSLHDSYGSGLYLSLAFLLAGIVCSARFIVSDHSSFEIYSGLAVGLLGQYIGWIFVSMSS